MNGYALGGPVPHQRLQTSPQSPLSPPGPSWQGQTKLRFEGKEEAWVGVRSQEI